MRLKEIKPNTAIHCTSKEQIRCLINVGIVSENYAEFDVPIWIGFYGDGTHGWMPDVRSKGIKGKDYYKKQGLRCVEFSDLIIPEMTAAEAVQWIVLHYGDGAYAEAFGVDCRIEFLLDDMSAEDVVSKIIQWKADHEKKEPEIETVDICRIIEILPDGRKQCVHEEDIKSELPFGGDERQKVEEILKKYCMEHDGEYIAVHEVVSRVKAVK